MGDTWRRIASTSRPVSNVFWLFSVKTTMGDRDNPDSNPEDLDSRIDALVRGANEQHPGPLVSRLSPLVTQLQTTQETSGSESQIPRILGLPLPYPHYGRPATAGIGCRAAGRLMLSQLNVELCSHDEYVHGAL